MIFKSRMTVAAHPDLDFKAHLEQLDFSIFGRAAMLLATKPIQVNFDAVPVHLTIPFLHRRVVAGTIGPFRMAVRPIEVGVETTDVRLDGKLGGADGLNAHLHADGRCRAEIEVQGETPAKVLKAAVEGIFEE
jgi:hypothetical protein